MSVFCRCRPAYLTEEAHELLSKPGAFDGLRVHTDEFVEVLARIKPETVTVAVVRVRLARAYAYAHPKRRSWTIWIGSTPRAHRRHR